MHEPFELPEWVRQRQLPDEAFAQAYHDTLPHRRALIKATIARLFLLLGERREAETARTQTFDNDASVITLRQRDDIALIVIPEGFASPAKLLAALAPAQLAGVPLIAVAIKCDALPANGIPDVAPGVLATMELTGVETCFHATEEEITSLSAELAEAGAWCSILSCNKTLVQHTAMARITAPHMDIWCWFESPDDINVDDVEWAYGTESDIHYCGHVPEGLERQDVPFEVLEQLEKHVAIAQDEVLSALTDNSFLALSPDVLGLWLWPGLTPDTFYATRRTVIG